MLIIINNPGFVEPHFKQSNIQIIWRDVWVNLKDSRVAMVWGKKEGTEEQANWALDRQWRVVFKLRNQKNYYWNWTDLHGCHHFVLH